jgi:hypothetical protein
MATQERQAALSTRTREAWRQGPIPRSAPSSWFGVIIEAEAAATEAQAQKIIEA